MKYSNVLAYSLIPARIAAELQAKELGVIDFGKGAKRSRWRSDPGYA